MTITELDPVLERVLAEAADAVTYARDGFGNTCPMPAVIAHLETRPDDEETWGSAIQRVSQEDWGLLAAAWQQSLKSPGELVPATYKVVDGTDTSWLTTSFLNLLDDERFRVVVGFKRPCPAPPTVKTPMATDFHRVEARSWVLQHLDITGTVLRTEGESVAMFGVEAEETVGRASLDFVHPDDHGLSIAGWLALLGDPGGTRTIRQRYLHDDGTVVWLESIIINHLNHADGCMVAISHDIGDERVREAELAASERRLRFLAEAMPIGVFEADASGRVLYGNTRFLTEIAEVGGSLLELIAEDDASSAIEEWQRLVTGDLPAGFSLDVAVRDGRILRVRAENLPDIRPHDSRSQPTVIGNVEDITAEVISERALRQEAEYDSLTGVLHRAGMKRAWQHHRGPYAVLFIDLDGFKDANDRLGHAVGDLILQEVADRLRGALRPDDTVARYGGDEFVVLVPDISTAHDGDVVTHRMLTALEGPFAVPGGDETWHIRASIGLAMAEDGGELDEVLVRADAAMYAEKRVRANLEPGTSR